jgi:hypothetical protein
VILFGAGATRGAFQKYNPPPPLDGDFFDIAGQIAGRGTKRLASHVAKDVFGLYGRVSGVGLEQYFREIETRAEVGTFAKSKNKPKDWAQRQRDLEELIRRVLLHTTCELDAGSARLHNSDVHRKILAQVKSGDTLVTFNYDTVIEESMPYVDGLWDPSDGYGFRASGTTLDWARMWRDKRPAKFSRSSQVRLLKLHGSLNWTLYQNKAVRLKPRPYVVRARNGVPVTDKCSILPPGWHKRIDKNPFRELWRRARLEFENCSSLAIVGYSLPETDLLARALFAEVNRLRSARGHFLHHLYLAEPNSTIKDRFVTLFAGALGPKGRVYRYDDITSLSRAWENSGVNR